ncbi:hypothetical protein ACLKA7_001150 [Drosophila subpalustris]
MFVVRDRWCSPGEVRVCACESKLTKFRIQLLGISFFFKQPEDQCSPAPTIGSWLFLLATLCFLWDLNIYPVRYMHMAKCWQLMFEIIAGVFLVEMSTLVIWCTVELVVFVTTRKLILAVANTDCIPWGIEYWLQGLATTVVEKELERLLAHSEWRLLHEWHREAPSSEGLQDGHMSSPE